MNVHDLLPYLLILLALLLLAYVAVTLRMKAVRRQRPPVRLVTGARPVVPVPTPTDAGGLDPRQREWDDILSNPRSHHSR